MATGEMDFYGAVKKIVDSMIRHIQHEASRATNTKHTKAVRRKLLDGSWSTHARAKRARSPAARGRRHCRGCGKRGHDLRNCEKGAANGKR